MKFVNELISDDDKVKFQLDQVKRPPLFLESIDTHQWTINSARDVFLVWTRGGNEDERSIEQFALSIRGSVCHVKLDHLWVGDPKSHRESTWRLKSLDLPKSLEASRAEVIQILKDALAEYRIGGISVPTVSHNAKFKF
jgi:hypothetical protein